MNYNVDEIKRFATRLEQQVSNSRKVFDCIDYDLRKIHEILRKYDGNDSKALAKEANNFADGWYQAKVDVSSVGIKLSANILGFWTATSSNQVLSLDEIRKLKTQFQGFYKNNSQYASANNDYTWANGQSIAERAANNFTGGPAGDEAGWGGKPSTYDSTKPEA